VVIVIAVGLGVYAHRESAPKSVPAVSKWIASAASEDHEVARAGEALKVLQTAPDHGLDFTNDQETALETALDRLKTPEGSTNRARQLAELGTATNRALLAFAHDVAIGRFAPSAVDPLWKTQRAAPDFAASLDQFANRSLNEWIASLQPHHPQYGALQQALRSLRSQEEKGGWPKVPMRLFKPGMSDASVTILRERLAASGDLSDDVVPEHPAAYDESVKAAVQRFQGRHGLTPTGIVDKPTLTALNVPLSSRIRQVEMNLQRWRWMTDDFGDRHFVVNIPAFLLMAQEDGHTTKTLRVIVGKPGHETPIFSGEMETVVFSPYWNIPDSIAEDETAPTIRQDPDYLTRNQIEVVRRSKSGVKVVNPDDVNWYDPNELKQLSFRQRPGAKNALGHVKFLFPNAYNVYLHDTPTGALFARTERAFSHGCVRVEEPEALASYVLRDRAEWTAERISSAMNAGVEKYVTLDESIPVHIIYFTTWVDENGALQFLPDVYGYDARQAKLTK